MEHESVTELMAILILQLGIILFAIRFFGNLAKKIGVPQVLGELIAGIIIGPYALGGIQLPGFPHGIFPLAAGSLSVSTELYAFAIVASIILLFASGLETNIRLFLRYSLAGGIISTGGVLASFAAGCFVGMLMFQTSFTDPRSLFLGVLITSNSLGIVARLLSDQKKMDSPESVTILAASLFDDVLTIIALSVVLGIIAVIAGDPHAGEVLHLPPILATAAKVFGIWLGCVALGVIFSKKIANFLKLFKDSISFSILALGIALILGGIFEKQGLAMIIGAYIAGLALSKTDIAPVIQECTRGLYEFFVPIFFAVMGMMVNFRDMISLPVLAFGGIYAAAAIIAKLIGCGGSALFLGFNVKGAMRIGLGMAPRGEMTLILAGIGLAIGILSQELFAVLILMILLTTVVVPPLLNASLKLAGSGTRKPVKGDDTESMTWKFPSSEIADLVVNTIYDDLRDEGFYVQVMNFDKRVCQARKDDIILSIAEEGNSITIKTSKTDMQFVKTEVYEVIVMLHESIRKLKESSDPKSMKKGLLSDGRSRQDLLAQITQECISVNLSSVTKEEVITELVDILAAQGKLLDRDMALSDVFEREKTMSTGMSNGIALPHAKTDGVEDIEVAIGIKKEGIEFESMDGEISRIFILLVSPKKTTGPHIQFLAAISSILSNKDIREEVINATSPKQIVKLFQSKNPPAK
ncbi:MAG: cation:proton antiporter [Spirochaetaceae bacterium]|nr:cation:proton antiporter [Spirochaetaceae bacterium]